MRRFKDLATTAMVALIIFSALLLTAPVAAALEPPALTGRVVDNARILSGDAEEALNDYFRRIEEATGAQIAVLTVPSLEGDALEDFSIRVVDAWQLGRAGEDDGVLLLIATGEKKIRLEVGYGLEGRLTDASSGVIIREYIQPYFQAGQFENGVLAGSQAIGSVVAEGVAVASTAAAPAPARSSSSSAAGGIPVNLLFFIIIIALGGFGRRGGLMRALFWGAMLSGGGGRSHRRSSFGGGGGFSGGGFGGGGFSGGGGGFGGGGASGGW